MIVRTIMPDTLNATELRRLATECEKRARAASAEEQDRLLKMREAFLALAENADWLAGRKSAQTEMQIAS
jgi:hypothetical protein